VSGFLCVDCGIDTIHEYYMVTDEVWRLAGMLRHGGMLCIGCLETRIKRRLVRDDFIDAKVNIPTCGHKSQRLRRRLS
jgi:hypothetical protein